MAMRKGLAWVTGTLSTCVARALAHLRGLVRGHAAPDDVMVELTALGFRGLRAPVAIVALTTAAGIGLGAHDRHDTLLSVVSAALTVDVVLGMAMVAAFNRGMERNLSTRSALLWQTSYGILLWTFCAELAAANLDFFLTRDLTGEFLSTLAIFGITGLMGSRMGFLPRITGGGLAILFATLATAFCLSAFRRHVVMGGFALFGAFVYGKAELQKFALLVDQLRLQRRLQVLAETDALTGIANRRHFRASLEAACQRRDDLLLLMIDLDRFKAVNDTFGHETGDQLLSQVAARLRLVCRIDDVVARLGGDEFAVLRPDCRGEGAHDEIAERIAATLAAPYTIAGQSIEIGASVGWCLGRQADFDPDAVIHRADQGMYRRKSRRSASRAEAGLSEQGR